MLYLGHISKILGKKEEAFSNYRRIGWNIEHFLGFDVTKYPSEIRNIYYCALFSLEDRNKQEENQFQSMSMIQDRDFDWYKTFCKSTEPRLFGLGIVMIPDMPENSI